VQWRARVAAGDRDALWMDRALRVAERGIGLTSPNPAVGAVLVKDQRVVGEGAHLRAGGPHAEAAALDAAGPAARGATCYVTLEPCAHFGRTPPCADALLRAGVARVVAAVGDPHPEVDGRGLARLHELIPANHHRVPALRTTAVALTLGSTAPQRGRTQSPHASRHTSDGIAWTRVPAESEHGMTPGRFERLDWTLRYRAGMLTLLLTWVAGCAIVPVAVEPQVSRSGDVAPPADDEMSLSVVFSRDFSPLASESLAREMVDCVTRAIVETATG